MLGPPSLPPPHPSRCIFRLSRCRCRRYAWSGPGAWSPKSFTSGLAKALLQARDWASGLSLYGELLGGNAGGLEAQMDKEWGWILDYDVAPVWLSEFGGDLGSGGDMACELPPCQPRGLPGWIGAEGTRLRLTCFCP